jgi:hypothetical protein
VDSAVRPGTVTVFTMLALGTGCLPEGEPGVGEPLVAARSLSGPVLTRPAAGAAWAVLYGRRGSTPRTPPSLPQQLFDSTPPEELYFLTSASGPRRLLDDYAGPAQWDAEGRLYLQREQIQSYDRDGGDYWTSFELWRFALLDLSATGLGRVRAADLSPGGTRLLYEPARDRRVLRALTASGDEREQVLENCPQARFLGEDLYYLQGGSLWRLRAPDEPPVLVLPGPLSSFPLVGMAAGRAVLLTQGPGAVWQVVLIQTAADDPAARVLTSGPRLSGPVLSPDGGRVAWLERAAPERGLVRIVDLASLVETAVELPLPPPPAPGVPDPPIPPRPQRPAPEIHAQMEFRPGSDELWCFLPQAVSVVAGDGQVRTYPVPGSSPRGHDVGDFVDTHRFLDLPERSPLVLEQTPRTSRFSADGRLWTRLGEDGEGHLGQADRPGTSETVLLFSKNSFHRRLLEVVPGQRAVFWLEEHDRRDLYLLDLDTRSTRLLARDVADARLGARRAVVRSRVVGRRETAGPADLSIVDYATGQERELARNVTSFDLLPACLGCDPTAPGARLVYVVHARIPWKHDGLWGGPLP